MIELPLSVELEVETDSEYEMEVDTAFTQGGATNFVEGSFVVGTDTIQTIEIPYEGEGYPIALSIWLDGGATSPADDTFRTGHQGACGSYSMVKAQMNQPSYAGTGAENKAQGFCSYKVRATSMTYTSDGFAGDDVYNDASPTSTIGYTVRVASNKTFRVLTDQSITAYYFAKGYTYRYCVVYSE